MHMRIIYIVSLAWMLLVSSCDSFRDVKGVEDVASMSVAVNIQLDVENLAEIKDLTLKFDNYDEDLHLSKECAVGKVEMDGVIPGIYTITVSGTVLNADGDEFYVNGNLVNKALFGNVNEVDVMAQGLKVSPLVFKEIYYAGSRSETGGVYFRDQFYEIYNNSSSVLYLDGLYIANLTPSKSTLTLPVWPKEDGDNYAYAERVWKFPGNGTDYPLEPGESCVISQFAANHQLPQYNPLSPIDGSTSEFEFNMNNANFPDQAAYDMVHVFYDGKAEMGTVPQYLTSVFGPAMVLFQVPQGETWDPVNDASMKTTDLSKPNSDTYYAKIPVKYVLDAVECIDNESKVNAKRMPAVLDAGITYVGATYCGLGVARKLSLDENGEPIRRENGALIFQDTNNSTDDFERGVVPMLRRYDVKMPSWNHTLR